MKHLILFEKFLSAYYAPLYTSKRKSISIETFKDDIIKGNIMGGDYKKLDIKKRNAYYISNKNGKNNIIGVSLTRNKDLRYNGNLDTISDIQFTFDTEKLKNKYRIIPYDYYGQDIANKPQFKKKSESEELLVGDLNNVGNYIIDIEFNSDTIYDFYTESDKIEFFWSVGKFLEKYPLISISSIDKFGKPNNNINRDFFNKWMNKIKTGDFKDIVFTT